MSEQILETYVIRTGSIKVIERFFDLPLNYDDAAGQKIRVFARNLVPLDKAKTPEDEANLPYCEIVNSAHIAAKNSFKYHCASGGPGFEVDIEKFLSVAAVIHERGYQTLWLDPRGTGLSTPFSADLVSDKTDQEIFEYLKHFRADNIVRDCEAIRNLLLASKPDEESRRWTILGQSFGGFCALTYLSFHPEGLKEVFVTAGLPPLVDSPDHAFRTLEHRVLERNAIYYSKYPNDVERVRDILAFLDVNQVSLPNGGNLSPNRFLHLGISLGMQGGIDKIHQIVFRATNDLSIFGKLSYGLLQQVEQMQSLDSNPIYAILHEVIYCQGHAANWSAERILKDFPQHSWKDVPKSGDAAPVYFLGEMVFPDMLDDYSNLRPLKGAAQLLAEYSDWPRLYDLNQLANNSVKVTAASYYDDMYVDFGLAQETAAAVKNLVQYISNEHHHSALRREPQVILNKLFKLSKREYD
ncbi:alpha/beta-hydrolase [Lyophyllum atratum]|nr:alpha/beta-hydrolase [Lyophyllum atratum]